MALRRMAVWIAPKGSTAATSSWRVVPKGIPFNLSRQDVPGPAGFLGFTL